MSFSTDVSAGDTILASHHNNIRKDIIDVSGGHNHDGVGSRLLADDSVAGTKLADAVAGNGLSKDGSENLQVNVDGSTIEISSDSLRVKAAGITGLHHATSPRGAGTYSGNVTTVLPQGFYMFYSPGTCGMGIKVSGVWYDISYLSQYPNIFCCYSDGTNFRINPGIGQTVYYNLY